MRYVKRVYTEKEIEMASDERITNEIVCANLGISISTLLRLRKSLGLVIGPGRGAKKGVSNPNRSRRESRTCRRSGCTNTFNIKLSSTKQYCSHSCHTKCMDYSFHSTPEAKLKRKLRADPSVPEYQRYASLVHRLSGAVYLKNIDIINPERHPRTRCGVDGGWQLDHITTIRESFDKGIAPEDVSSLNNLRMLPWKQNLMRNYEHNN